MGIDADWYEICFFVDNVYSQYTSFEVFKDDIQPGFWDTFPLLGLERDSQNSLEEIIKTE
jgi:hypothetical protein